MRVSSPRILVNCGAKNRKGAASESDCLTGKRTPNSQTDLVTDNTWEQCSACTGMFRGKRGLKIHQTRRGCGKQLSESQRKTPRGDKSEATSTQDTNHSDARGDVNQETTLKGIGSQSMEAMDKFTNRENEKMTGESCRKKMERSIETALLRNWFKRAESIS